MGEAEEEHGRGEGPGGGPDSRTPPPPPRTAQNGCEAAGDTAGLWGLQQEEAVGQASVGDCEGGKGWDLGEEVAQECGRRAW